MKKLSLCEPCEMEISHELSAFYEINQALIAYLGSFPVPPSSTKEWYVHKSVKAIKNRNTRQPCQLLFFEFSMCDLVLKC